MRSKLNTVIDEVKEDLDKPLKLALLATVTEAKAFSQTLTSKTQPPARKGEGRRKAYSGLLGMMLQVFLQILNKLIHQKNKVLT